MGIFSISGWNSRKRRLFAGKNRRKGTVVSGGLPTIGSTPVTFGQVGKMGKIRRRKGAFGSSSAGFGGATVSFASGGYGNGLGAGFSSRRRSKSRFLGLAVVVIALVAVFVAVKPLDFHEPEEPVAEPTLNVDESLRKPALLTAEESVDENGIVHGLTEDGVSYLVYGRGTESAELGKVTFVAVGDQVGSERALDLADSYAGTIGDGSYDFWPFYQEIAPIIESFDIAYINQETVMAGTEKYGYSGYPTFNTPDAAADAIEDVGFDIAGFASNHVYDLGEYGVQKSHEVWNEHPDLMVVGSYESQEDRDAVRLIERGGASIAVLQYCYGDNYLGSYENFPNAYNLAGFDKDAIRAEVQRAQTVANVVVVALHAGTEYDSTPNEQQVEYAQFLADLGVDLVIGSHAHITQPVVYLTNADGKSVPVVYGMSDIVSGWDKIDTIMSGLFTCEFSFEAGEVKVSELAWHPCIEWSDGGQTYVRLLADMDAEAVNANVRVGDCGDDYLYIKQFYESLPMEIPVVWERGYARSLAGNDSFSVSYSLKRVCDRAVIVTRRGII